MGEVEKRKKLGFERRPSFSNCVSSTGGGGRNIGISPEKNALSESGGAQGGAISFDGDSVGQIQRQTLAALSQSLHSLRSLQEALAIAGESAAVADAIQHLQTVLKTVEALRLETGDC